MTSVLPSQSIRKMISDNFINDNGFQFFESQIQPSSLDLRVSDICYEIDISCLPMNIPVMYMLDKLNAKQYYLDDIVLQKDHIYIIPLIETIDFVKINKDRRDLIKGIFNTKSSIGRLDVMVRTITDNCNNYNTVSNDYQGPLYIEVVPKSFPIKLIKGLSLNQVRFIQHNFYDMYEPHSELDVYIDLEPGKIIGYTPRKNYNYLDLKITKAYNVGDFWEPIISQNDFLNLEVGKFYILKSYNDISIPPDECGEMECFNETLGELRSHYAGFFDGGFGYQNPGTKAVLEMRVRDVPMRIQHKQLIGKINMFPLTFTPDVIYGDVNNTYQGQALKLSKYFK